MQWSRSRWRVQESLVKSSAAAASKSDRWRASADTEKELPTCDPLSDVAKKERSRLRYAENAIHVIPLVVVLCAIILWFFSNPAVASDRK